jgi:hypothetical protein
MQSLDQLQRRLATVVLRRFVERVSQSVMLNCHFLEAPKVYGAVSRKAFVTTSALTRGRSMASR